MDPARLRKLVEEGESFTVEFKGEEHGRLPDDDLVDAVICLANGEGGWLLVGVEDDGRVTGARPRHEAGFTDPLRVQALIANKTRPSLSCRSEVVVLDATQVLAIEVPPSGAPVGTTDGRYTRRGLDARGRPACLPYHFHEMQARLASRGALDPAATVVAGATWDDLDPLEFERFRRFIRESPGQGDASLVGLPDLELAKSLGAVEANHEVRAIRLLGLLLFGREDALRRLVPTHEVAFQVLAGVEVEVNQFLRWPLLRAMDEVLTRFRARNREQELMAGALRIGVPDYPERAFREAVANALIHRDYTQLGAVHVQWHDAHIEVSNPGGFPEGVHLGNLLVTPPRPRNPLLADAFKRAGLVERTARGIDTIFYQQLRNGRPPPSYERSAQNSVVVVLFGGPASLELVRLVVERGQAGQPFDLEDLLVLHELHRERRLTASEAAGLIQKPLADARAVLERLVESDLVEARGSGKGRVFLLSASTYKRFGEQAAHIRQRGFEPVQQEQMVLQWVKTHGSASRAEVSDLCRLESKQASRLLQKLSEKGLLRPTAKRGRAVRYVSK